MYGNPETTPGGRALKFWASVRLEVRRAATRSRSAPSRSARAPRSRSLKNKVAPPFRVAEFDMIFGKGISRSGDLLDVAVVRNIVSKAGTYFNYGETRLGQGRDNARNFLDENPAIFKEIDDKVRDLFKAERAKAPAEPVSPDEEEPSEEELF